MLVYDTDKVTLYLRSRLEAREGKRRGIKSQFARAIGCDGAYVTRILEGSALLSLEQGMRANAFLVHTPDEAEFFLAQISFARAGSKELKAYFSKRMESLRETHRTLSRRIKNTESFPEVTQATYYSLWAYAAIDIATSLPSLQTVEALSRYFRIPAPTIASALSFLRECGVVEQRGEKWVNTQKQVYLASDSPHIRKHHLNWRLKAMQAIESLPSGRNLHYSSVISISKQDLEKLKEHFIQSVGRARELVKASTEDEILAAYNVDCFELN